MNKIRGDSPLPGNRKGVMFNTQDIVDRKADIKARYIIIKFASFPPNYIL